MDRVLAAARLHLVRPLSSFGVLWLIVGAAFALNVLVWQISAVQESESATTGGLSALYGTVLVINVMAVTQLLPFAMGMGLSRRSFFVGTGVAVLGQAVVYGVVLTALEAVEDATGGWGVDLQFWGPSVMDAGNPVLQVLVYAAPVIAAATIGVGLGIAWKRWGNPGIYGLILGVLVIGTLALALIGWLDAWQQVGDWFADQSMLTFTLGLPLALTLVIGALSFAGLRRVVP